MKHNQNNTTVVQRKYRQIVYISPLYVNSSYMNKLSEIVDHIRQSLEVKNDLILALKMERGGVNHAQI